MERNIESALKQALVELRNRKAGQVKGQCLTDNELAAVIDGNIPTSVAKRDVILEHLLSCPKCFHEIKETLEDMDELENEGMLTPPEKLVQSAMALVSEKQPVTITDLEITCYPMARAGKTTSKPPKMIKKITFVADFDGLAYFFKITKSKACLIIADKKIIKGRKTELKSQKPLTYLKNKNLILIVTKNPIKSLKSVEKTLLNCFKANFKDGVEGLKKNKSFNGMALRIL